MAVQGLVAPLDDLNRRLLAEVAVRALFAIEALADIAPSTLCPVSRPHDVELVFPNRLGGVGSCNCTVPGMSADEHNDKLLLG